MKKLSTQELNSVAGGDRLTDRINLAYNNRHEARAAGDKKAAAYWNAVHQVGIFRLNLRNRRSA